MATQSRRNSGFTLIEIAIVIVIVGILLAMIVGVTASLVESARLRATRANMDAVKAALVGFIARTGRLPCPAIEDRAPAATDYGVEAATPGTCTGTLDLPGQAGPPLIDPAKRGVVPWKSLGMTLDTATDGWGNQFTYMVTVTATNKNFDTVSGMRGSLYVHSAVPVAVGAAPTGNQINACSITANDNACNRAAVVVVVSHGRNLSGAYPTTGVRSPLSADTGEIENTNADRFVVSVDQSNTFDDLVLPIMPGEFLGPLAAQGTLRSERALLQERAREVLALLMADSVASRSAGLPGARSYPLAGPGSPTAYTFDGSKFTADCTTNPPTDAGVLTSTTVVDPWSRPLRYAVAKTPIVASTTCPSPVVIVSLGPDGIAGSADDFVYYSPLGEWLNVFSQAGW